MMEKKKRQVSPALQMLLSFDVALTNAFCKVANKALPQLSRTHHKALEISCHGLPWLVCWAAFILFFNSPSLYQIQANFLFVFFLDITVISIIKAFTRRRRPANNKSDMFLTVGPDKFSFPSGHASRAAYISYFFISLFDTSIIASLPLLLWAASVCASRVLLQRHHVLDVVSGVVIGVIETMFVSYFWLSQDFCVWLLSIFSS